jgi:hypothetical protein
LVNHEYGDTRVLSGCLPATCICFRSRADVDFARRLATVRSSHSGKSQRMSKHARHPTPGSRARLDRRRRGKARVATGPLGGL